MRKYTFKLAAKSFWCKEITSLLISVVTVFGVSMGLNYFGLKNYQSMVIMLVILICMIEGLFEWRIVQTTEVLVDVEREQIKIQSGCFIRRVRYVAFEKLYSISQQENIIQKKMGISTLNLHTAGKKFAIEGISRADSEIMQALITKGND